MTTVGQRVKQIIVYQGSTMTKFAKELNISQSMVSKICSDKAHPSDRTISDICRIFNINKEWLLNGVGEMTNKEELKAEILDTWSTSGLSEQLKESIASTLSRTPPAAWPLIAEYLNNLADECNKNQDGPTAYLDGYREGFLMAQKIRQMIEGLSAEPEE